MSFCGAGCSGLTLATSISLFPLMIPQDVSADPTVIAATGCPLTHLCFWCSLKQEEKSFLTSFLCPPLESVSISTNAGTCEIIIA